jgi:hypothetical protein
MFDTNDKLLITTILKKYTKYIKDCMKKTLEYKLIFNPESTTEIMAIKNDIKSSHLFFPIGIYYKDIKEFKYYQDINNFLLDHIEKNYDLVDIFGSDSTIKKLFNSNVQISAKEHLVILCLIAIMNPAFNIVKFELEDNNKIMKNKTMYALVKLNIECELDYDKFLNEMSIYKSVINISNFYDSNNKKLIFL